MLAQLGSSLRSRLLALALVPLLPVIALILYTDLDGRRQEAEDAEGYVLELTRRASGEHASLIERARRELREAADVPAVRRRDSAACNAQFAEFLREEVIFANIGAADPQGNLFCSAVPLPGPVNIADQSYFQRAIEAGGLAIGEYEVGRVTGRNTLNFAMPLNDGGTLLAVVYVAIDLAWLDDLAVEAGLPEGAVLMVIDRTGTILNRYPGPEWIGKAVPDAPITQAILGHQGPGTAHVHGLDGVERVYGFAPLKGTAKMGDAYVSIGIPTSVVFREADERLAKNLVILGLVSAIAATMAWFAGSGLVLRPVRALVRATRRLGAGELTARTGPGYGSSELSQLARAFDDMAASLEQREAARAQAEQALHVSEARLTRLADNAQDIIYRLRVRPAPAFEYLSPAVARVTGYAVEEFIRDPLLLGSIVQAENGTKLGPPFDDGPPLTGPVTARLVRKDGAPVWVESHMWPVFDDTGQRVAFEGIARDITERIRDEEQRRAFEAQMQQAQKLESLGLLTGGIAHDFNNLLVGVLGNASLMLQELPEGSRLRQTVERIEAAATRASDLTNQMLAYSGRSHVVVSTVRLAEVVREMFDLLGSAINKRVTPNYECAPDAPPVEADVTQVRQVVMNLITNASEALADRDGSITIRTFAQQVGPNSRIARPDGDPLAPGLYAGLAVTDTAGGMDGATQARVFEPFLPRSSLVGDSGYRPCWASYARTTAPSGSNPAPAAARRSPCCCRLRPLGRQPPPLRPFAPRSPPLRARCWWWMTRISCGAWWRTCWRSWACTVWSPRTARRDWSWCGRTVMPSIWSCSI
ncbi:MAG: HAMP domain-containing protein [Myxococcales bacterium]|nr:HAMP domain-containing protein [Myxococcales bacterium]